MLPDDVQTIQQFIAYCSEALAHRPEYMREKEQEPIAAYLVGLYGNAAVDELEKEYPQVTEILNLASDLEWSNVDNTTIAWRHIKVLVAELDQQVNIK